MGTSWPSETWKAFTFAGFLGMILAGLGGSIVVGLTGLDRKSTNWSAAVHIDLGCGRFWGRAMTRVRLCGV